MFFFVRSDKALAHFLLHIALFFILLSCTACPLDPFARDEGSLTLMSYNLQNLFDDVSQGSEYPEYDPANGTWGRDAYDAKLAELAAVIRRVEPKPDLILVQEAENSRVLERLSAEYLPLDSYDFAAAPQSEGAAAQTGLLSSLPIRTLRCHRAGGGDGERHILELELLIDGERFVIFNSHWKSRIGGRESTEEQRILAARFVARRIAELESEESGLNIILAGDLNADPYQPVDGFQPALAAVDPPPERAPVIWVASPGAPAGPGECTLYSGWENLAGEGSYRYAGLWERIDHFLWTASLSDGRGWEVADFLVWNDPLLLNEYGSPRPFSVDRLDGYSDHLPLILRLEKRP